jgi:hypothetical protein
VRHLLLREYGSLAIPPVGPVQPIFIAGECPPARHAGGSHYGPGGNSSVHNANAEPETEVGGDSESGGYSSASSMRYEMQFTQESASLLQQQHQQKQHAQQQQGGHYGPASAHGSANNARTGRGAGRGGRGGRFGNNNAGRSRQQSQQQAQFFNPTSHVTPLGNAQTDRLLRALGLPHIWTVPYEGFPEPTGSARTNRPHRVNAEDKVNEAESGDMWASFGADLFEARAKLAQGSAESSTDPCTALSGQVQSNLKVGGAQHANTSGNGDHSTPAVSITSGGAVAHGISGYGGLGGDYGFGAYYGATAAVAEGATNSLANNSAHYTRAGPESGAGGGADPSELDIDAGSEPEQDAAGARSGADAGCAGGAEDPNAIDLDL